MVKVEFDIDVTGYVQGYTLAPYADEKAAVEVDEIELQNCPFGATKLVDGHLVVDADKQAELIAEAAKPVPTEQDSINAAILKSVAQTQLANATLLKQMATMQEVVNNG